MFRWGDPAFVKTPKESLYKLMKQTFGLTDEDFSHYAVDPGLEEVKLDRSSGLSAAQLAELAAVVGAENLSTADYDRFSVAYGKTGYDLLRARERRFDSLPDAVAYPADTEQVEALVAWCVKNAVPLTVYGGGSSVTRGVEPVRGGLSLDMRRNFRKILAFSETDQTVTVQAGLSGPELEAALNDAPKRFGAQRAYTCGHFPQSFEYSSVGGWVVTRGAGQNSTYYGTIADIVLSQRYATPRGTVVTPHYPRQATGPDLNQMMMGSEGTFGVLTEVTLKVFRYMPQNRKRFSYLFKSWPEAMDAAREMMQAECGHASVFRLSDPEETGLMLRLYNVDETPLHPLLETLGYKDGERCLFLGFTDGEAGFSRNVARSIRRIARSRGAMSLTGAVCKSWEKGRFTDPYLRDSLMDFGVVTDTIECAVNWSNMAQVHRDVRRVCHALPHAIVTTHMSHCYPQGANLYFIFITPLRHADEFLAYVDSILDAIRASGAAISHHHGVGKLFAPWLEGYLGKTEYGAIRALKDYFDPGYVMNPGGTLGLDLPEEEKRGLS